jgi:hypothetical protein
VLIFGVTVVYWLFIHVKPINFGNFELEQTAKLLKGRIDSNKYLQTQNENEAGKVRCEMRTETDNDIQ